MINVQLKKINKFNFIYNTEMEGYMNLYSYTPKLDVIRYIVKNRRP